MEPKLDPLCLLQTTRGKAWVEQFLPKDRITVERFISTLTLISHSEFERSLENTLNVVAQPNDVPCAFFAVREINPEISYFEQTKDLVSGDVNALSSGSNHGSEARVAALLRNLCMGNKNFHNHPKLDDMRIQKIRNIILVDDFIGSGHRVGDFLFSMLKDKSIRSWFSSKYVRFVVVAYSGTSIGIKHIKKHKALPEIQIFRDCPSIIELPMRNSARENVLSLCKEYGEKTSRKNLWGGYNGTLSTLVFEHGCPNNAPAILWAPESPKKKWMPLFPNRVVGLDEKNVFPKEAFKRDFSTVLENVGQKKLAHSGVLTRCGETGRQILMLLAFIAQGRRTRIAYSYATGLNVAQCEKITARCIAWGFITSSHHLTVKGKAELLAAKNAINLDSSLPEKGEDYYYPKKLRGATRG